MTCLLGIDFGTSSVKALLMTEAGACVGKGAAEYTIQRPAQGYAEQNPDDWWQRRAKPCTKPWLKFPAQRATSKPSACRGRCTERCCSTGKTEVLTPAIIWQDQRSAAQVAQIAEMLAVERLTALTGSPACVGFQAGTLRWLQQERPDLWQNVAHVLLPKDYLRWRMTDVMGTDPSDACGTLLFDIRQRVWSQEMLELLGIQASLLPPIQPAIALAGSLSGDAAGQLGLAPGTPVVTGAADTACSMLGAGLVGRDTLLVTITLAGRSSGRRPALPLIARGGHLFCCALEPAVETAGWYQMAGTLSAGLSLRWLATMSSLCDRRRLRADGGLGG